METTTLLKQKVNDSGYKLSWISEQLGITRYSLTNKLNKITEFKSSEISMLCKILSIDKSEIAKYFF